MIFVEMTNEKRRQELNCYYYSYLRLIRDMKDLCLVLLLLSIVVMMVMRPSSSYVPWLIFVVLLVLDCCCCILLFRRDCINFFSP